jgi:aryl-alcohol dehydrogenase-like predicted oxidoreductase
VCQFCETAKRLGVPLPVSIQNDFSPVLRVFEGDLAEACAPSNYNIGLLAYGVLAGVARQQRSCVLCLQEVKVSPFSFAR